MPRLKIDCMNCGLAEFRLSIVKGRGNVPADILMMGEAPGKDEDRIGLPFVGESGQLLDVMLDKAEELYNRERPSIHISNTILCRPTDYFGGDNRKPSPVEVIACRSNIMDIYNMIDPIATIFVGKECGKYYKKLLKPNYSILHPAFMLRQGGKKSPYFLNNVRKLAEIFQEVYDMKVGV